MTTGREGTSLLKSIANYSLKVKYKKDPLSTGLTVLAVRQFQ